MSLDENTRAQFERIGVEAMRLRLAHNEWPQMSRVQAIEWLAEHDQHARLLADSASAEQASAAARAADAADRAATAAESQAAEARQANKIAKAALAIAIISAIIAIVAIFK
jgi:hypothetical protein